MPSFPDYDNSGFDSTSGNAMRPPKKRHGMEQIPALDAADSVALDITILKESYDEILDLLLENEWEREEGIRTVLLAGLGYLQASSRVAEAKNAQLLGDAESAKRMEALLNDLAQYHQQYSVMKFKAFKLYKLNQVLEFNVSGLRATERMWEGWAERMRRQHTELQSEVIRLRALMSEFKIDWDVPLSKEVEAGLMPATELIDAPPTPEDRPEDLSNGDRAQGPTIWVRLKRFFER